MGHPSSPSPWSAHLGLTAAAAGVALVAVDAVVHIPVHVRVVEVGGIIAAMALSALENGVVIRVGMARGANAVGIAVARGELRVQRMVKRRRRPGGGRVARIALRRREERGLSQVSRIGGPVVRGLVAADAGQRQRGVVVIHVAQRARRRRMRSGQRPERRGAVIKRGIGPEHGVMAYLAGGGETRSYVVNRSFRVVVIRLVARHARCHRDVEVAVHVAQRASGC